jgi:hypothetical protein
LLTQHCVEMLKIIKLPNKQILFLKAIIVNFTFNLD